MTGLDWGIVAAFVVLLVGISVVTNRMTKSVAGFLSAERLAGRYLLTIAMSMAFLSAIGIVGGFEANYRNGIGGQWWNLLLMPVGIIIALSGWVAYRYRETRAMTIAQFLEMRYSRKFRVFAGLTAFFSGMLNCAVFPMVTANFMIWFLDIPMVEFFSLGPLAFTTYHLTMVIMIGAGVILAVAGGQNTIMVTSFFQGIITSAACLGAIWFILTQFGWDSVINTMLQSEFISATSSTGPEWFKEAIATGVAEVGKYPDMVTKLQRPEGVSMMNPFAQGGLPDFGPAFFIMMAILLFARTGVWQGNAGFLTAAKTPHEAKMGNVLGSWRWLMITIGTVALAIIAYEVIWNPMHTEIQNEILATTNGIGDKHLQSQMFVPIVLRHVLPPGMMGLFAIFMIGASVSTDDSAYHSWGSIFLQDVVMPFRKKPFTTQEHLKALRWSILLIGVISFIFSSVWTMKEFINMWFEITGAIYIGGASCAIIGGLYWKRGTTSAAWAGLITGSVIAVTSIVVKQIWPELTFPWNDTVINGIHTAVISIFVSFAVYVTVSLLTCKKPFNMDKMLHRGEYAVEEAQKEKDKKDAQTAAIPKPLRIMGITNEFTKSDTVIYVIMVLWTAGWSLTFILGTIYNLTINQVSSEGWITWWSIMLGIQLFVSVGSAIWFAIGGTFDTVYLFKKLAVLEVDEKDDGMVYDKDEE